MSRSVSRPNNTLIVCYQHYDSDSYDECWEFFIEDMRISLQDMFPKLESCDKWLDREDHAIMENDVAYVGVSEYMGLVAIWVAPKNDRNTGEENALAYGWASSIYKRFTERFGELEHIGTFSNGEAVFRRMNGKGHITSNGYDSENI